MFETPRTRLRNLARPRIAAPHHEAERDCECIKLIGIRSSADGLCFEVRRRGTCAILGRSRCKTREENMRRAAMLAVFCVVGAIVPAAAADVTGERLPSAPKEPQNWLMVHRDYNNSRHSPLREINRDTVKDLKLKFLISIGGTSTSARMSA